MTSVVPMRAVDLVISTVWYERGDHISEFDAYPILWSQTGFPGFWKTKNPTQEIRDDVVRYLRGEADRYLRIEEAR